MEFIKLDENQKIWYFGKCKITINNISKQLIAEPIDDDLKIFSSYFDQKMIQQRNVLFVFTPLHQQEQINFILIFSSDEKCSKFYNLIKKSQDTLLSTFEKNFFNNFLATFLENIQEIGDLKTQMAEKFGFLWELLPSSEVKMEPQSIIENDKNLLIKKEVESKEEKINQSPLKRKKLIAKRLRTREISVDESIIDSEFDADEISGCLTIDTDAESYPPKKRKIQQLNSTFRGRMVEEPNFELKNFIEKGKQRKCLIIFENPDKTLCRVYHWKKDRKSYTCIACLSHKPSIFVNAKICRDKNVKYVKLNETNHVCQQRKYNPKKFEDGKIVKKPNYEILEYNKNGKAKTRLFIFPSLDKKYCYEYRYDNTYNRYQCLGCDTCEQGKARRSVAAHLISKKNGEEEYVEFGKAEHVCEPREYNPEKYTIKPKIIRKPYFQLLKRRYQGRELDRLIIFHEADRNLCYEYNGTGDNKAYYYCVECQSSHNIWVHATLIKDEISGDYFKLQRSSEHLCFPQPFVPEDLTKNIITSDNFIMDYTVANGKERQRLVVFDQNYKDLCYIYHGQFNDGTLYWSCFACRELQAGKRNYISARLFDNKNGEKCVELSEKPHLCKPQKYVPIATKILKPPDFVIIYQRDGKQFKNLIIFDDNDKTLCYRYTWPAKQKKFRCQNCVDIGKTVTALFRQDENGQDYIVLRAVQHYCKPQKYVPFKIVKTPDFMISYDSNSKEPKKLIIYDLTNKNLCRVYSYKSCRNYFMCIKCRDNHKNVTAWLCQDKNGEDYIELSLAEHICKADRVCELKKFLKPYNE